MTDKEVRRRTLRLRKKISAACVKCGLNLTVYNGKIGFVDQEDRKIVALWEPKYTLPGRDRR